MAVQVSASVYPIPKWSNGSGTRHTRNSRGTVQRTYPKLGRFLSNSLGQETSAKPGKNDLVDRCAATPSPANSSTLFLLDCRQVLSLEVHAQFHRWVDLTKCRIHDG